MKIIPAHSLIDMQNEAEGRGISLRCELVYADAAHPFNQTFKTALYTPQARLWLHRDLAEVVLFAAQKIYQRHGVMFVLADGLRPIEAQAAMGETPLVKANPHWTQEGPKMLISKPGAGAHPRGMAIDIWLERHDGTRLDMGTDFDYFTENPDDNPAARNYAGLSNEARNNRALLDGAMQEAAHELAYSLYMLPSEWWDFRAAPDIYEQYAPISDADLPVHMRMCA